nr:HAD-IA family hydrolase [Streptomyces sp. 846.5]
MTTQAAPSSSPRPAGIRAVLLDSGGVLMQPKGGRWNPRADFETTVLEWAPGVTPEQFARAVVVGDRFMDASRTTPDMDAYHRVMLDALGVDSPAELLAALVRPVPPTTVLETFPEVVDTLQELRGRGIRLAVVSDAWPNLPELHAALGLDEFFEVYAISAVLGCRKPDPRMYHHASEGLGLEPGECLFVDDDPALVRAAIDLGYQGLAMCRDGAGVAGDGVASITSLTELLESDSV